MWRIIKLLVILTLLGGAAYQAYARGTAYLAERSKVTFRTAKVTRGDLEAVVSSTGEVKPVLSVSVGSFVSGPITQLHADFNDRVEKGQLLAEVDPRLFQAGVDRDRASLATRRADVDRVKAQLQQAVNDETRATKLRRESEDFISQAEIDRFHFGRMSLEAQLEVAEASVLQAEAQLKNTEANLNYTKILAPVSGIVIDRKIDPGQTLAAQFQTPELFVIAPEMEERMHIFASVDEADIGMIREAKESGRPVKFTVDAYPDEEFTAQTEQIRFSSTTTQNVVTYPVVVSAPNPDLKLLPGMTANLSFQIEERNDVVLIPNAALRYFPPAEKVREEDRWLITGDKKEKDKKDETKADEDVGDDANGDDDGDKSLESDEDEESPLEGPELADASVEEEGEGKEGGTEAETSKKEKKKRGPQERHVWVAEDQLLKAIKVTTGLSDSKHTEMISGELTEDMELVTGIE